MEIWSIDEGNLQTKVKSRKRESVLLSSYIETSELGLGVLNSINVLNLHTFESDLDEGIKYTWGNDMHKLTQKDSFIKTLKFEGRYASKDYQLLSEFSLGYLALDFEETLSEDGLDVTLSIGVPTEDFFKPSTLDILSKNLKKTHVINVDGTERKINVLEVIVSPQPLGTIYDLTFPEKKTSKPNTEYLSHKVGVVDIGGGTILMDLINVGGQLDSKGKQFQIGAHTFYDELQNKYVAKVDSNTVLNVEDIPDIIKSGSIEDGYFYQANINNKINITDIVKEQMREYTRNKVLRNIEKTFQNLSQIDYIIFTGGGANLLDRDYIEEELSSYGINVVFNKDSELSNARGFYKYASFNQKGNE